MVGLYRLKAQLLPFVVILLIRMQLSDPPRFWSSLLVGFGWAWLSAYFGAHSLSKNIRISGEMRYGWAQVGDQLEERFTLVSSSTLPATWAEVSDQPPMPGDSASLATGGEGDRSRPWVTSGRCIRKGLYWLRGTSFSTGDPLGIFEVSIEDRARTNPRVLPPAIPLPPIEITPGGYPGEGRPRPNAPKHAVGAAGVREYTPDDSLRAVHRKSFVRKEKLFVRLFDGAYVGACSDDAGQWSMNVGSFSFDNVQSTVGPSNA